MRLFVVALAVFALLGVAAGGYSIAQETPATPDAEPDLCPSPAASPDASPAASPEASPDVAPDASPAADACATPAAADAVMLEAWDIGWRTADQPGPMATLTVAPGTTIQIVNAGVTQHNFDLSALGLFVDLPPGGSGEAMVPADAPPGEYEFICTIPGHASAGMVGTLTVQ